MKMNVIVGKKQIMLSALVLALGVAVYLNYQYSRVGSEFPAAAAAAVADESTVGTAGDMDAENYGEAYFAEARLSRSKSRDEAVQTLAGMLSSADLSAEQKTQLAQQAAELARSIETEGKIENLIKAKGFQQCMVYYDTKKVDVVVQSGSGLTDDQVAQMQDVIQGEVKVPAEDIRIVEVK